MTIRKGAEWGQAGTLPAGAAVAADDVSAAAHLGDALVAGREPVVGLIGGDLARTVGAGSDPCSLHGPAARRLPIDVIEVTHGEQCWWAVSHVVLRRPLWQGPFVAAMNAEWLGDLDLTPRGHPNDGRFEVLSGRLGARQRWSARRRARLGEHLPHPDLSLRSRRELELDPVPGWSLYVDRQRRCRVRQPVALRLLADAAHVVVAR